MVYSLAESIIKRGAVTQLYDVEIQTFEIESNRLGAGPWTLSDTSQNDVMGKVSSGNPLMGDIASRMFQGIRTSANEVYVLDVVLDDGDIFELQSKSLGKRVRLERKLLKPFLRGEDIKAYSITKPTRYVLIPYHTESGKAELISSSTFKREFPLCWKYLLENRTVLEAREDGKMKHENWYAFVYPKNLDQFGQPKIITPDIAPSSSFALDEFGEYTFVSGYGIVLDSSTAYDLRYMLALLNSRTLDFYLKKISSRLQQGFYRYFSQYIAQLPIRRIDFADPADKSAHDEIVKMVEEMLELQKQRQQAEAGKEDARFALQMRIEALDKEIDARVYRLYGLTEEEIKVVEVG